MNFQEIYETAIAEVVSLTQTERILNTNEEFVKRQVNRGYHKIEKRALWKFSEGEEEITVPSGSRNPLAIPSDLAVPLMVYSHKLNDEIAYHDERQRFYNPTATGTVEYYGIWDDEFRVYPLPRREETFTLRYYRYWTDLSLDGDVPVIPDTFHDLLIDHAAGKLAQRLPPTGDRFLPHSLAQPFLDSFHQGLELMADSDLAMKTWDAVPNYDFHENVLGLQEW